MKYKFAFCLVFLFSLSYGQDSLRIQQIRDKFDSWQKILDDIDTTAQVVYNVFYGKNYNKNEWTNDPAKVKKGFIGNEATIVKNEDLGIMFILRENTPSGDWSIYSENYYDKSGKLYFVFRALNTFQALEPLTVEKRLYFNEKGDLIKSLENIYKMNTKEKVLNPDYMKRAIKYWLDLKELPFFNIIN